MPNCVLVSCAGDIMQGLSSGKRKQSHIIVPTDTAAHLNSNTLQKPLRRTRSGPNSNYTDHRSYSFPHRGIKRKILYIHTIISAKMKPKYQTSCTWRFLSPVSWTKLSQIRLFLNISSSKLGLSHLRGCSKLRKRHQRMSKQSYRKKFLRHLEYFMNFKCFVRVFPRPSHRSYI